MGRREGRTCLAAAVPVYSVAGQESAREEAREARVVGVEVGLKIDEIARLEKAVANADPSDPDEVNQAEERVKTARKQLKILQKMDNDQA